MTPDVPSKLSPSAIIRTSRKRHVTTLKITLLHHINALLTYFSIIVCCLAPSLKKNILELEIFFFFHKAIDYIRTLYPERQSV